MAIIVNNEPRIIILTDAHRSVRLLSGANLIDNDQWSRIRPAVADRIGEKTAGKSLTEIGVEFKKDPKKGDVLTAKGLSELDVKTASDIIRKTLSLDALNAWKREVSREDLRAEILTQIENMEKR